MLAAKAGAYFVSPFIGRLDDIGQTGMEVLEEIVQAWDNYEFSTRILAASLRHAHHFKEAVLIGADIATVPFSVLLKLFNHSLTDVGLERFLADWEKVKELV